MLCHCARSETEPHDVPLGRALILDHERRLLSWTKVQTLVHFHSLPTRFVLKLVQAAQSNAESHTADQDVSSRVSLSPSFIEISLTYSLDSWLI